MGLIMKTKTIKQYVTFRARPHDVYEALMNSDKHVRFTGGEAHISQEVGGKFSAFDGYSEGVNIELVPDEKIVQSWRASDWPEGHYSKAIFIIEEDEGHTRLTFTQSGVPEEQYEDIAQGWQDYYWGPMKKMLEK
jgi:activator of HSP90 ATPase